MNAQPKYLVCFFIYGLFVAGGSLCHATTIFTESWENPPIAGGTITTILSDDWFRFSGPAAGSQIWHPDGTDRFNDTDPLASPADDNQILFLSGVNTGIYRMGEISIQPNTTYTLKAAIGNDLLTANTEFWSLQFWADTDNSGVFEGSFGGDSFIGQEFGLSATALNATPGDWVQNSFSFDSSTTPTVIGSELVVFLNNFGNGASFYDSVSLSAVTNTVPEPASFFLLSSGIAGLLGVRIRRSRRSRSYAIAKAQ